MPQTLCFDADDTLWENNIYFEQAIAAFISFLDHQVHTPEEVREHLNTCERATIAEHGYGLRSFRRSLLRCFAELSQAPLTAGKQARILAFADVVADATIELLEDVDLTLRTLAGRHRLLLITKGDRDEQVQKLRRSKLQDVFSAVEVPREKTSAAYRDIADRHHCKSATTWMIGNSPRSDINPALSAGWNAVYLPHPSTWVLEHEPVEQAQAGRQLLYAERFRDLLLHF